MKINMSTTVRRIVGAAATVVVSATTLAVAAPSASASGSGTACPTNRLCFYFNSDFGGARADFQYTDGALNNELFTDGPYGRSGWGVVVGNNAASVKNRTGEWVGLFPDKWCGGYPRAAIAPGSDWNLARFDLKNRVSSIRVGSGACTSNPDQSSR